MNLYEYQGKQLLAEAGVPVPRGVFVSAASQVDAAVEEVGLPCMVKAQLQRGGRGKAGLIRKADSAEAARKDFEEIQSAAPDSVGVLIEECVTIERELYFSLTIDPVAPALLAMASGEGGVEIETLAAESPEKIVTQRIRPSQGVQPFHLRNLLGAFGLDKEQARAAGKVLRQCHQALINRDATLVEINPLVLTSDGRVLAADSKFSIDDNALWRQQIEGAEARHAGEVEREAAKEGIPFFRHEGDIGLMCAGAGLTNTIFDLIHDFGGKPANFLEFGGPNYRKAREAMRLTLMAEPKVILIVTFGTIARADVMAQGVAKAIAELKPTVPIVTAIRGTGEEDADRILREAGLEPLYDTEEAVRKAIELAAGVTEGAAR